jgi:hypothetical protein
MRLPKLLLPTKSLFVLANTQTKGSSMMVSARSLKIISECFILVLFTSLILMGCSGSGSSSGGSNGGFTATANTTTQSLNVGTAMDSFTPLTATGGTGPYTYSYAGNFPAGLNFNTSTGAVTGTPTTVYYPTALMFRVQDATGNFSSTTSYVTFAVYPATTITAIAYSFTPTTLDVAVPIPFNYYPLIAHGGWPYSPNVYNYIASGVLPAGLIYDTATGLLSGSPTTVNASSVTVTFSVQDSLNNLAGTTQPILFPPVTDNFTNPFVFASAVVPTLTHGVTMTTAVYPITAAGGRPAYTYSYTGTLPIGLTFNPATCAVYGTPASQVTTSLTFTAFDAVNTQISPASTVVNITIN